MTEVEIGRAVRSISKAFAAHMNVIVAQATKQFEEELKVILNDYNTRSAHKAGEKAGFPVKKLKGLPDDDHKAIRNTHVCEMCGIIFKWKPMYTGSEFDLKICSQVCMKAYDRKEKDKHV